MEMDLTLTWKDNILISNRGIPVVADLGLSKVLTSSTAFSAPSTMGNPAWTSPELHEDDAVHTLESDVWACGMTILVCSGHLAPLSSELYLNARNWLPGQHHIVNITIVPRFFAQCCLLNSRIGRTQSVTQYGISVICVGTFHHNTGQK